MQAIDYAWERIAGDAPPIAHELRSRCSDRWVRFHSLPESKRYAESTGEYVELLSRHNTIIDELATAGDRVYLVTSGYSSSEVSSLPEPNKHVPEPTRWRSVCIEHNWHFHTYYSEARWKPHTFDSLLRLIADDVIRDVAIIDGQGDWAYHPYDGGGDAICPDTSTRDRLSSAYASWRSRHPQGL